MAFPKHGVVRYRLTLESQLCFLANLRSCCESILGWRKDLGESDLRALGPPPFPSFSWQMVMRALRTTPWAGQQREHRGENSPAQAVKLTVRLLQLGPCCMGGGQSLRQRVWRSCKEEEYLNLRGYVLPRQGRLVGPQVQGIAQVKSCRCRKALPGLLPL